VAKTVPTLIKRWPKGYAYLADQLKRAVSSIALNIAEGNSRYSAKERLRFFSIARASAAESAAIFDIAEALNLVSSEEYSEMQDRLIQIVKMLYKLK